MPRRFLYKMQSILDVRDTVKRAREMDLMRANLRLANSLEALAKVNRDIARAQEAEPPGGAPTASFLAMREKHLERLKIARSDRENDVRMAQAEVERRRKELVEANVELKKMERNKDAEKARWERQVDAEEQKANDEIAGLSVHYRQREEQTAPAPPESMRP